jgi:hypothetical protein
MHVIFGLDHNLQEIIAINDMPPQKNSTLKLGEAL